MRLRGSVGVRRRRVSHQSAPHQPPAFGRSNDSFKTPGSLVERCKASPTRQHQAKDAGTMGLTSLP
eukprot:365352-Chlamydomonas_euryale.AAC.1